MSTTTYKVKREIDPGQLKRDLSYSLADLSNAMVEQAALFAHYGGILARAARQVDNFDLVLDTTEAAVYRKIKDELTNSGDKIVVADIDRQVRRHEKVIAARKALNEAKQIEAEAKTAVEAFRHRRDMLVQQGLISREEMKGELAIQVKREKEDHIEDLKSQYLERVGKNRREET